MAAGQFNQTLELTGGAAVAVEVGEGITCLRLNIAGRTLAMLMTPDQLAAVSDMLVSAWEST